MDTISFLWIGVLYLVDKIIRIHQLIYMKKTIHFTRKSSTEINLDFCNSDSCKSSMERHNSCKSSTVTNLDFCNPDSCKSSTATNLDFYNPDSCKSSTATNLDFYNPDSCNLDSCKSSTVIDLHHPLGYPLFSYYWI